ncbi:MAG: hypothetical protein ND866_01465 [Pyrinomonadaceae bacterium]|nr:hypothetical protein [Pyrinomonadaceae bacterium]
MQNLTNDLYSLAHDVLTELPSLFVMLICIVVAIVRWKRHPRVSLIVILALTFLTLVTLASAAVFIWVPRLFVDPGNYVTTSGVYAVLNIIYNGLFTLALGALLLAVFIQRPSSQRS